ncbi:acyltransferase family protein [Flavobacterium sp.]|uniref:acyltransferase family protein n=1 Tax=Flavobacterium sp. TaxID=239 RepID=UPI00352991D1
MEKKSLHDNVFGLDFMRTLAIVLVLFGHSAMLYPPSQGIVYQTGLFCGFFGVEIFFVLAGFFLGRSVYRMYVEETFSKQSILAFFKRKGIRFLPNYYLVLILNLIISLFVGYKVSHWWKYFFFVQNFSSAPPPFFPESWSIPIGVFAFLLFPFVLFIKTKLVKPKNKPLFFLAVVLGLVLFFTLTKVYYALTNPAPTIAEWNLDLKSVVVYRLDAIFIGVLAGWVSLNRKYFWEKSRFLFAVFGVLLFGFMFIGIGFFQLTIDTFPNFWSIIYLPLTSFTCMLFLPFLSQWNQVNISFIPKLFSFTGKIAYAVYLLHYSVILQLLVYYFPTNSLSTFQLHFCVVIYLSLTILASTLLYRFFEKSLMDLKTPK